MSETVSDPSGSATAMATGASVGPAVDLRWVWSEVRKRVFIKLPFSLGVADAMEAVVPIALDGDMFIVGMTARDFPLAGQLQAEAVRNTIESILRAAAGRAIRFEVIEGTGTRDWLEVQERRQKAQDAVVAMAQKKQGTQHVEDVVNQIVSELRSRISSSRDRALPQVKAGLLLDIAPQLADAQEMLFPDPDSHDSRRQISRLIDRIAGFLEVTPLMLSIEVERHRRNSHVNAPKKPLALESVETLSQPTAPDETVPDETAPVEKEVEK